jgi:hypothetical protein
MSGFQGAQESQKQTNLLTSRNSPELSKFCSPRVLRNNLDFTSVTALDLLWPSKEVCQRNSQTLQCDENEICLCKIGLVKTQWKEGHIVGNIPDPTLPFFLATAELYQCEREHSPSSYGTDLLVQSKDNGTSKQRPACPKPKPDAIDM